MFFSRRVPPGARKAYNNDALSGILGSVMTGMTLPFVIVIARHRLHASKLEVSLLIMAPVMGHITSLIWANLMQGRRKMPYAVWPWVIARALFFFVIFATCSKVFVAIMLLFWLIGSIASPAYSDLMKEVYPDSDRAKIMGFARICTVVAYIIVTLVAGELLERTDFRCVFPVAAVFGIISAFVFNRIPAKEATGERGTPLFHFIAESWRLLWRDKGYLWFCTAIFVFGFANFMASPAYALYEVDVLKAHEFRQSIYSFVVSAVAVVSYFYWGSFLDRRRPEKAIAWQTAAWAFIPLMYLVATKWWMLLPAKIIGGFIGAGTELVYCTGVLFFAPKERVSQYYAVFLTLMGIRGIAAPLLGGALLEWHVISLQWMFAISAAIIFASVAIQIIGYRRYPNAGSGTD